MRTIGRALLILAAAAIVAGTLYIAVGNESTGSPRDERVGPERSAPEGGNGGRLGSRQAPRGDRHRHGSDERGTFRASHHDREGVSLGAGITGVVRSAAVTALITLAITRTRLRRFVGLGKA